MRIGPGGGHVGPGGAAIGGSSGSTSVATPVAPATLLDSWALEVLDLDGPGSGWVDTSDDVRADVALRWEYGITGSATPIDRVGSTGKMDWAYDNAPGSPELIGRYSPYHANKRVGFGANAACRLRLTYGGTTYEKFRGVITNPAPEPGKYRKMLTRCTALDWMDTAARVPVPSLPAMLGVRSDTVVSTVLGGLTAPPPASTLETGIETFSYALDGSSGQQQSVREELQKVCLSEFGYAYMRGGAQYEFFFEARRHRSLNATTYLSFDNDMSEMSIGNDTYSQIRATGHPVRTDALPNVVLFELAQASALIASGQTIDNITGAFRDPISQQPCGGLDMQPLIAGTDYAMNTLEDGSGADITAYFTVTPVYSGQDVKYTVTNNGGPAGYVTKLRAVGRGVYRFAPVMIERTVSGIYGDRLFSIDLPYQANVNRVADVGDYLAALLSSPTPQVPWVKFLANASDAHMAAAIALEPGARIAITEEMNGLDETPFTINGVAYELQPGGLLWVTWSLEPARQTAVWLIGTPGASEIGATTVIGF